MIYKYTACYTFDSVMAFIVQFISVDSRMRFGLLVMFFCSYITPSHYHRYGNLYEDIELINCLSDIFCRVCE